MTDDEDELGSHLGQSFRSDAGLNEVADLMDELRALLKTSSVVEALTERGINSSLALVAVDGVAAYLRGDKLDAVEDLRTVAEEIEGRILLDHDAPSA